MLKHVVILAATFCLVHPQRPWHAGTSSRLPPVLPQYLDEQAAAAAAAQAGPTAPQEVQAPGADASVVNRIGDVNVAAAPQAAPTATIATTRIPPDLPVDAHGDVDLINRIKTWPRDKQPFWYINWQAIQAHRGDANNTAQPDTQTQLNSRSFFAG